MFDSCEIFSSKIGLEEIISLDNKIFPSKTSLEVIQSVVAKHKLAVGGFFLLSLSSSAPSRGAESGCSIPSAASRERMTRTTG